MDMKSRFRKLGVESLEGRSVLSTVDYGNQATERSGSIRPGW
jgi:hypothetical protein